MRTTKIICPDCRALVAVIDKMVEQHGPADEPCGFSGTRYSPQRIHGAPGGPKLDVNYSRPASWNCGGCGSKHSGIEIGFTVKRPDPRLN